MNTEAKRLRSRNARLLTAASAALCLSGLSYGDAVSDIIDGLKDGSKATLNARARYEYNKAGASEVNGYSIRTRLGFTTGEYQGFKAMIEMEDVSFNDPDDRPALDVPVTELNQYWLSYSGVKLGRQIYTLDDQRFIGHVGWRQNIQTFDAITGSFTAGDAVFNLGYLDQVNRVNATTQDLDGILGNVKYKFNDNFDLVGFAYLLDFDKQVLASSDTFGLRGTGKFSVEDIKFAYSFSYALQTDNSGSDVGYALASESPFAEVYDGFDLSYMAADISADFSFVKVLLGTEILEGDGTTGFTTPLATVHKFNGFADVFAGPSLGLGSGLPDGLEDYFVTVSFKAGPVPIALSYHEFDAENVSVSLGSEIDAVASYKLNEYVTFITKYAKYSSDGSSEVSYGGADKTVFTLEANIIF